MKRTKKAWAFFALQMIFFLIAPCVMVWMQYGDLTEKYKISVTAIMLSILIFWVFKKIVLNKWLKTLETKLANIETNALSITDTTAIESNKKAWRNYSICQLLFSSIIPLLLFILAVLTIKTVEQGLIKLYGCLMFCLISVAIGVLFRIAEIFATKLTHEK
jgi:hypothetical protein